MQFHITRRMGLAAGLWAIALLAIAVGVPTARAAGGEEGFKSIFDGKSLAGWDGDPRLWRVEEGTITGETTKENRATRNTFLIWRGGKPADFELKAEFCMPNPGFANSGIQIRSWEGPEKWRVSGYQPDMDGDNNFTGICYGENYRGMLAQRGQKVVIGRDGSSKVVEKFGDSAELAKLIKLHHWNEYDIVAKGNHITERINGHLMCEVTDEDTVAHEDGIIALQIHAGPPMKVQFRNIRLKEFPAAETKGAVEGVKKVVFIAGPRSHGYAQHAHFAGCTLLAKALKENVPQIHAVVVRDGWPKDTSLLDDAAVIVIYSDGGGGHPIMQHLDEVEPLMKKGVGLVLLHYAVEIPKGAPGDKFLEWVGGYYETFWSVNPFWTANFKTFPEHPVANGLQPFAIEDEWYYHMRFPEGMKGVTPILTAVPPDSTRNHADDAHGGNPEVRRRKGMAEHVAWAFERPDGGRGFGFTGGHVHWNWANDNFRRTVLNAIVWAAHLPVPPDGVPSKAPTVAELLENQEFPTPANFNPKQVEELIHKWNEAK